MSTSLFSSFEALYADSIGHKVPLYWAPPPPAQANKKDPTVKIDDDLKKGKDAISSSQPEKKTGDRRRIVAPRFAPEFDGIHCFETIVPW